MRTHSAKKYFYTAALLATLPTSSCLAQAEWNNTTSGDWFNPANWDSGLPNLNLYTAIDNGGQAIIAAGDAEAQNLRIGDWNDGNLLVSGGTLYVPENIEIARAIGSTGQMDIQGGTVTVGGSRSRFIVSNSGGGGQLNLSGGSLFSGDIDVSGGIFNHSGGTIERWPNGGTAGLVVSHGGSYHMSGNAQATLDSLFNNGGEVTAGGNAFLEIVAGLNIDQGGTLTLQENAAINYAGPLSNNPYNNGSLRVGG